MLKRTMTTLLGGILGILMFPAMPASAQTDIRWGTSAVGSSGHKALVALADMLNREMKDYRITVQPTAGAVVTVKGFATEQFDGYYGSDVAFHEYADDTARFKGFKANIKREPVQSFWAFTLEVGFGIHERNKGAIKSWSDLSGKRVFTGPLPWDTRAQAERLLATVGAKHQYVQVDLSAAGSLLDRGGIDAFAVYSSAEASTSPWIAEASLSTEWTALNPSPQEIEKLGKGGFTLVEVKPAIFNEDSMSVRTVMLAPFYYGFHVGLNLPADAVYEMLTAIEKRTADLAGLDKAFAQIAENMPAMQKRGVASSIQAVPVHPGLAKYMREKGVWDASWDSRIARK